MQPLLNFDGSVTPNFTPISMGTYRLKGDACTKAVLAAIRSGYRRVDTAAVYRNERQVGEAIRRSGVPRDQLFVTSKLHPKYMVSKDAVVRAVSESLEQLDVGYIDLFLIHWPAVSRIKSNSPLHRQHRLLTWQALMDFCRGEEPALRAIGVSNFTWSHVEQLVQDLEGTPDVFASHHISLNQVEFHPLIDNSDLVSRCHASGVVVEAYSPLGEGNEALLGHALVKQVAQTRGISPVQVLLRWVSQQGIPLVVKSAHEHRIVENLNTVVTDDETCALRVEDLAQLAGLGVEDRHFCWDPRRVL